jgi:hypothetical protein
MRTPVLFHGENYNQAERKRLALTPEHLLELLGLPFLGALAIAWAGAMVRAIELSVESHYVNSLLSGVLESELF